MGLNYKRIPSNQVDDQLVRIANQAALDAARILNIAVPRIQWVNRYPSEKAIGWVDPRWDVVHLAADWCEQMGPEQTRALIFHEARHIWQKVNHRYDGYGYKQQSEDDAESFSFRHTRTMIERPDYKPGYINYYA